MQRLIMVTGDLSHFFESAILEIIDPSGEVLDDVARHLLQLLPRLLAQLHPMSHIVPKINLPGEYVYPLAFSILRSRHSGWMSWTPK